MTRSLALLSLLLLALASSSAALADSAALVPPVATVDDPRAERERVRVSYLLHDEGVASYAMRPRVRHPSEDAKELRSTSLLAFPSAPERRPLPAGAVDGLAMAAGLFEGGLDEQTPLLPTTSADPEVVVLAPSLEAVQRWAQERGVALDEGALAAAARYLEQGWTLVGSSAPSPAPPVGFRFRAERPTLPPDLLADDEERERVFLLSRTPMTPADDREADVVKRLSAEELESGLEGDRAEIGAARRMLAADVAASRAGALLLDDERRDVALQDVSSRLQLSGHDVGPLLPPSNTAASDAVEAPSAEDTSLVLTVLEGDLRGDGAAVATTFEPAADAPPKGDSGASPLVRRLENNRVFRLLQKVWN